MIPNMYKIEELKIICPKKEAFIVNEAIDQFRLYKGKPENVVDIGAHIGIISLLAAKRGAKHVLAFEPIFRNFKRLMRNIQLNHCAQITPIKMAVAGKIGYVTLYSRKDLNSGQNSVLYNNTFEVIEVVPALNLHTILKFSDNVSYLKIDVEGGEFDILMNTQREDLYRVEYLDLEIHDPSNFKYFQDNDYSTNQLLDFVTKCGFDSKNSYIRIK